MRSFSPADSPDPDPPKKEKGKEKRLFSLFPKDILTSHLDAGNMCLFLPYHALVTILPAWLSSFSLVASLCSLTSSRTSKWNSGPLLPRAFREISSWKVTSWGRMQSSFT